MNPSGQDSGGRDPSRQTDPGDLQAQLLEAARRALAQGALRNNTLEGRGAGGISRGTHTEASERARPHDGSVAVGQEQSQRQRPASAVNRQEPQVAGAPRAAHARHGINIPPALASQIPSTIMFQQVVQAPHLLQVGDLSRLIAASQMVSLSQSQLQQRYQSAGVPAPLDNRILAARQSDMTSLRSLASNYVQALVQAEPLAALGASVPLAPSAGAETAPVFPAPVPFVPTPLGNTMTPSFSAWTIPTCATSQRAITSSDGSTTAATSRKAKQAPKSSDGSATASRPKKKRRYSHENFPEKLHRLILEAKTDGKDHIVRFTEDGKQFQILHTRSFELEILPRYFRHNKIDSFKRLLHMYGFSRTQGTWNEGTFEHAKFRREQPELCKEIHRIEAVYGSLY